MNIKNLVIAATLAIAASSAFAAEDSYLYWMVGDNVQNLFTQQSVSFDYATVKLDGEYLYPYVGDTKSGVYGLASNPSGGTSAYYWGAFDCGSNFLFELWNEGVDDAVGSLGVSYSALSEYIRTVGGQGTPPSSPYVLTNVVPEPTSGLLSIFGLAVLAIRRRRRA